MSWLIWFFGLDPRDLLALTGVVVACITARWRIARMWRASAVPEILSGSEAAALVFGSERLAIARTAVEPTDFLDHRTRTLRLSPEVFDGRTAAAVGIAAHEAGHATEPSGARIVRGLTTPWTALGARAGWLVLASGIVLDVGRLFHWGAWLLAASTLAALATLPIERAASRRGRQALSHAGIGGPEIDAATIAGAWANVARLLPTIPWLRFGGTRPRTVRDDRV